MTSTPPPTPSQPGTPFPPVTPSAAPAAVYYTAPPPKKSSFLRRLFLTVLVLLLIFSLMANFWMSALLGAKFEEGFDRAVVTQGSEDATVAIYNIEGVVNDAMAQKFEKFAREALKNDKIKAIVLRVDSPGGTVSASDRIHQEILKLKSEGKKKIVVSMGSLAASGGYYISAPADEIIAEPTTLTGSIGVIMEWLVFKGTLDKIGVEPVVMKSTHAKEWKDELSPLQKPTDPQKVHLQSMLDEMQSRFEQVVRDGRQDAGHKSKLHFGVNISPMADETQPATERADLAPFNGQIFSAAKAKELGLVDDIGYLEMAINRAKTLAGLKDPKVVKYETHKGLFERMMENRASAGLSIDPKLVEDVQTPRIMMIWKVQ